MQVLLLFSFFVLLARHGYSQALGHDGNGSQPSGLGNSSALPASINRPAPLPRNSSSTIKSLYQAYSDKTPKFINQPLIQFLSDNPDARLDRMSPNSLSLLKKRVGRPPGGRLCTRTALQERRPLQQYGCLFVRPIELRPRRLHQQL